MSIQNSWEHKYLPGTLHLCFVFKKTNEEEIDFKDHIYRTVFMRKMEELNTCVWDIS